MAAGGCFAIAPFLAEFNQRIGWVVSVRSPMWSMSAAHACAPNPPHLVMHFIDKTNNGVP